MLTLYCQIIFGGLTPFFFFLVRGDDTDVSRESAAHILRVTDFSVHLDVILSPSSRIKTFTLKFRC